jgi:pimeloyl-ACP methyl ester carboxylesterase
VLARHGVPRLALSGAATVPATRRIARLLREAWPDAAHAVLPGLDHMGPLAHAAVVNTHITEFLLRQVEPARRDAAALCLLQPETL